MKLSVALGADHGDFALKNGLSSRLRQVYKILDLGAYTLDPAGNYPDFVVAVAQAATSGQARGNRIHPCCPDDAQGGNHRRNKGVYCKAAPLHHR